MKYLISVFSRIYSAQIHLSRVTRVVVRSRRKKTRGTGVSVAVSHPRRRFSRSCFLRSHPPSFPVSVSAIGLTNANINQINKARARVEVEEKQCARREIRRRKAFRDEKQPPPPPHPPFFPFAAGRRYGGRRFARKSASKLHRAGAFNCIRGAIGAI